jgi:hypothetical protein
MEAMRFGTNWRSRPSTDSTSDKQKVQRVLTGPLFSHQACANNKNEARVLQQQHVLYDCTVWQTITAANGDGRE